ncbi:protease inhibitor I9 family protein [Kitasatospora sp. NBC_00374]|uniref:protease inhibitor I9 family protein n=1 Tax=Kitasatospora sp. NBC_00374 TaxID=2975964 RepID=UPI00324DA50D
MRPAARRTSAALLLLATLAAVPATAAARPGPDRKAPLAGAEQPAVGRYLVTLKRGSDVAAVVGELGVTPLCTYESVFPGFAADLDPEQLARVRRHPATEAVEADGSVSAFGG